MGAKPSHGKVPPARSSLITRSRPCGRPLRRPRADFCETKVWKEFSLDGVLLETRLVERYGTGADDYLHANCGHCHNRNGTSWPDTQMVLRLSVEDRDVTTSEVYRSIVGTALQYWRGGAITLRVAPAEPDASAVFARMAERGSENQMPPLATELVDPAGLDIVRNWIATLPIHKSYRETTAEVR